MSGRSPRRTDPGEPDFATAYLRASAFPEGCGCGEAYLDLARRARPGRTERLADVWAALRTRLRLGVASGSGRLGVGPG